MQRSKYLRSCIQLSHDAGQRLSELLILASQEGLANGDQSLMNHLRDIVLLWSHPKNTSPVWHQAQACTAVQNAYVLLHRLTDDQVAMLADAKQRYSHALMLAAEQATSVVLPELVLRDEGVKHTLALSRIESHRDLICAIDDLLHAIDPSMNGEWSSEYLYLQQLLTDYEKPEDNM